MNLSDSIDEMILLAQQIQALVLLLSQTDEFTDEQRADVQVMEQSINHLIEVLPEVQAIADTLSTPQILSFFSMECRTPINALMGYSEVSLRGYYGTIPTLHRETFVKIRDTSRAVLGKINDLLDDAKRSF